MKPRRQAQVKKKKNKKKKIKIKKKGALTNLDVSASIEQDIVTLDITVDDVLRMQVLKTTASLEEKMKEKVSQRDAFHPP